MFRTSSRQMSSRQITGGPGQSEGKLLIVCDDVSVRRTLHGTLLNLGFDIAEAGSTQEAIALCRVINYAAILLDMKSRSESCLQAYAELRRLLPGAAIFLLDGANDRESRVEALEAGVDDLLSKPLQPRELTARLRNLPAWALRPELPGRSVIVIGELSLDSSRRLVHKAGIRIHLTPNEFAFLSCLMTHAGMPVTHARLIHAVWNDSSRGQMDGLRTLVCQLRKKIEDDHRAPRYVLTEGRFGYRFADPEDGLPVGNAPTHFQ